MINENSREYINCGIEDYKQFLSEKQFLELFKNNLYYKLAKHANSMANHLKEGIIKYGYELLSDSTSNQIFPILPNIIIEKLHTMYDFHVWEKYDNEKSCIRLVTSWATPEEAVIKFLSDLEILRDSNP